MDIQEKIDEDFLNQGKILLWGDVSEETSKYVIERMRYVYNRLKKDEIYLYIHTDGGEVECALAIIDEIEGLKKLGVEVYTIAIGKAYSCGAFILAFGSTRFATENSNIMLHPFSMSLADDSIGRQVKTIDYTHDLYHNFILNMAKKCGCVSKKEISSFMQDIKDSLWLSPKEAINYGIIDQLWDYEWENLRDEG